jgi:hypothetical protein
LIALVKPATLIFYEEFNPSTIVPTYGAGGKHDWYQNPKTIFIHNSRVDALVSQEV